MSGPWPCLYSPWVGVTKPTSSIPFFFLRFSNSSKPGLPIEYYVHIWQVWLQLCCSDTCQIWTWLYRSSKQFCIIKNSTDGEINKWNLVTPIPNPRRQQLRIWHARNHSSDVFAATFPSDKVVQVVCLTPVIWLSPVPCCHVTANRQTKAGDGMYKATICLH